MQKFKQGRVADSLVDFDRIIEVAPRQKPYMWQRGLSLYYADRFEEGADQFRTDVAVNPSDTEESIWAMLCESRLEGFDAAREKMLKVGRDTRPYMREAYELFRSGEDVGPLLSLGAAEPGGGTDFYAKLYAGLFYEAKGEAAKAEDYLRQAAGTAYGQRSGDYMAKLAQVHCQTRGWNV